MVARRAPQLCMWIVAAVLGASLLLAQTPASAQTTPTFPLLPVPDAQRAQWTIMVYMAADNDLEAFALMDVNEMEMVADDPAYTAADSYVNVVVMLDRIKIATNPPAWDVTTDGDWDTTHVFRIIHDDQPDAIGSDKADKPLTTTDWGERDMADPQTLVDFVGFAMDNYPASNYALIMWNHGGGWRATTDVTKDIAYDFTSGDFMTTPGLAAALSMFRKGRTGQPLISVVGMDACLMGMVEVAYAIQNGTDYLVASEDLVPGTGMAYDRIVGWLRGKMHTTDPATPVPAGDLAKQMVVTYLKSYSGGTQGVDAAQMAAIDLSKMGAVKTATDAFASELLNTLQNDQTATFAAKLHGWWGVSGIYSQQQALGIGAPGVEYIDLGSFAGAVTTDGSYPALVSAGQALKAAINPPNGAVVYNGVSSYGGMEPYPSGLYKGLSIYYPFNSMPAEDYVLAPFISGNRDDPWYQLISVGTVSLGWASDPWEDDGSGATANTPALGSRQRYHWFHYADDVDMFKFQATQYVPMDVKTLDLGPMSDTRLYIYGPPDPQHPDDIVLLGTADDPGVYWYWLLLGSELIFNPPATGTYYAVVVQCDRGYFADVFGSPTYYSFYVSTKDFSDVATSSWAFDSIEQLKRAGIVTGYSGGYYLPKLAMTRDAMAVFIARAMANGDANVSEPTGTPSFTDVPADNWAYKYVEYAKAAGVVKGYADGLYHPEYQMTRGLMALFVARAMAGGEANVPAATSLCPFLDVNPGDPAYNHIAYLESYGVVKGYADDKYHPERIITREQMAVYIARAFMPQED